MGHRSMENDYDPTNTDLLTRGKKKKRAAIASIEFDTSSRTEFLTGFRKRKQQKENDKKERKIRKEREEKREKRREKRQRQKKAIQDVLEFEEKIAKKCEQKEMQETVFPSGVKALITEM